MDSFRRSLVKLVTFITLLVTSTAVLNTTSAATHTVAASSKRTKVAKLAKKQVGKHYVYGAFGPSSFDCSGLVQYVFKKGGKKQLPRTTYTQVKVGKKVSLKKLKKGDLLFWGNASAPYHVGVYVGDNDFVHAATPDQGVIEQKISPYFYPTLAKRVL